LSFSRMFYKKLSSCKWIGMEATGFGVIFRELFYYSSNFLLNHSILFFLDWGRGLRNWKILVYNQEGEALIKYSWEGNWLIVFLENDSRSEYLKCPSREKPTTHLKYPRFKIKLRKMLRNKINKFTWNTVTVAHKKLLKCLRSHSHNGCFVTISTQVHSLSCPVSSINLQNLPPNKYMPSMLQFLVWFSFNFFIVLII
jgi:hypothetical protein